MRRIEGWGSKQSHLVILGEAPGEREENVGQPFVGPSGFRLNEWMARVGLRREDAYIDNVYQHRPPGNRIGDIDRITLEQWMSYLHERISELEDPYVIVPTGNYALYALTGKGKVHWHQRDGREPRPGILDWRGSILEYVDLRGRTIKCIPTIHPAATFRQPSLERACVVDWERIASELTFRELRRPLRHHHINPSLSQLAALHQSACQPGAVLAIDIENPRTAKSETVYEEDGVTPAVYKSGKRKGHKKTKKVPGEPKIVCVGFALSATESITVPTTLSYWRSEERLAEAWSWIRHLCHSPAEKVLHNGLYDTFFLADHGIRLVNWLWDTLYMHHALDPSAPHGLADCASFDTREPYWKDQAKDPDTASRYTSNWASFLEYNGKDCCVTRELADVYRSRLAGLSLQGEPGLNFYLRHYPPLFQPLLDLSRHGIRIDATKRKYRLLELMAGCVDLQDKLTALSGVQLYGTTSLSVAKLKKYLYEQLALPKQWKRRKDTGEKTETVDEVAVRRLMERHPTCQPLQATGPLILEHRRQQTLLHFYKTERVDDDGRYRSSYSPNTEAGRLSSSKNPRGTGCVYGDVEVLTPTGWTRLDRMNSFQYVAQWRPDGAVFFAPAELHTVEYNGLMERATSWFHKCAYTSDHTIPTGGLGQAGVYHGWAITRNLDHPFGSRSAAKAKRLRAFLLPVSGHFRGGHESMARIRLLVAAQADGSVESGTIRFAFKKQRKIDRFVQLCHEAGITPTGQSAPPGYQRFSISVQDAKPILAKLTTKKLFGSWILALDYESLEAFVDELRHWDGSIRGQSFVYATVVAQNADWAATAAHLCGYSASLSVSHTYRGGYGSTNNKPLWKVSIRPRAYAQVRKHHWTVEHHEGPVYCLKTQTGFFLARSGARIFVTGNSNAQNVDREARDIFLADQGMVGIEVDASQAEARIDYLLIYMLTQDRAILDKARLRPDEYDQHTENAAAIFNKPAAAISKEERYLGKKAVHAAFRDMQGQKLADELLKEGRIYSADACDKLIKAFRNRLGVGYIEELFRWVRGRIIKDRYLENSWGRRLWFTYDRLDDEAYRRGYSFDPQSEVADLMNQRGLVPLHAYLQQHGGQINAHVHDSLFFSVPRETAYAATKFLVDSLEQPRMYWGVELCMPATLKIGSRWKMEQEWLRLPTREEFEDVTGGLTLLPQ